MSQCTAKAKSTGQQCQRDAMANGKCWVHGGPTPRGFALPQTKHGRHSKDLVTRLAGRYHESISDPDILNLSNEISLTDAFIHDALKGMDHGESGRLFTEMKAAWDALTDAQRAKDAGAVAQAIGEIGLLIRQGVASYAARSETMDLVEKRRRLVESEGKRRVAMQDSITSEKAMLIISALLESVVKNVPDRAALARITAEFGALTTRDDPTTA